MEAAAATAITAAAPATGPAPNGTGKLWGKLKEPVRLGLPEGTCTKQAIRQKVWEFMERNDIANFPRPVYGRIPNFKGAGTAGQKVSELPEFQSARTTERLCSASRMAPAPSRYATWASSPNGKTNRTP